jgi:hypothetical protein
MDDAVIVPLRSAQPSLPTCLHSSFPPLSGSLIITDAANPTVTLTPILLNQSRAGTGLGEHHLARTAQVMDDHATHGFNIVLANKISVSQACKVNELRGFGSAIFRSRSM